LTEALNSLAWVNQWFGNQKLLIGSVLKIIEQNTDNGTSQNKLHIIDLGCGGGDILRKLAEVLVQKNIPFFMTGIDGNAHALQYAREQGKEFAQINYLKADILDDRFTIPNCDILISSHFIYHFKSKGLLHFLKKNLSKVNVAFINSGLERNIWALRLFKWFGFFLPMSRLAKQDGRLAIQRAFTKSELLRIIEQLPHQQFELKRLAFFRLRLIIFPFSQKAIA